MRDTLIRGATVITMDRQGDLPCADILVRGAQIAEIAPRIAAAPSCGAVTGVSTP